MQILVSGKTLMGVGLTQMIKIVILVRSKFFPKRKIGEINDILWVCMRKNLMLETVNEDHRYSLKVGYTKVSNMI